VTFTGPDSVKNVIGRVTGGEPSSIDGTLASTIPDADLYLLNPAGILFSPNARLDVKGSFHASTADELRLGDGQEPNAQARDFRRDTCVSAYVVELAAAQRRRSGRNVP
jgi:filamentous hemagglutinin family protein